MKPSFAFQIAKVAGTPNDRFWSQVHAFSPEESEKKEKRGDLLVVLVIAGVPAGVEAVSAGREVLGRLHEEYYGNLDGSAFERLETAVKKVAEENDNLEIVSAVLFGPALYLAIYGKGKIFLKRGARSGTILKGKGSLQTASGVLEEDDLLVVGSSHFFEVVGDGILKASLEGGSATEAVETLAPIVLGRQDMAAAAAILALVKKEETLPIQPVGVVQEDFVPPESPTQRASLWHRKKLFNWELPHLLKRPIFVRRQTTEKRKRLYFLVSLILLCLLGVSLILGVKRRVNEQKQVKARELLKQAEEKLNRGKLLSADKPTEGKVLGEEAQNLTTQALSLTDKRNEEAAFLQKETEKFLSSLGQEVNLKELPVFMDLGLITNGASGASFSLAEKNLVILDSEKNNIYLLQAEKKAYEIIDYPGEKGRLLTAAGTKAFVLNEKGIFTVQLAQKTAVLKINKDEGWKEISGLASFAGNLYLLDKGANNIWRYLATDEGFGTKKSWFLGAPPDLSNANSLAIDGAIWILAKDKILKFNLGKQEDFSLNKMPESFLEPSRIYTSVEAENLYVLDKGRGKVYVLAKSGDFKAVYVWEGFKEAQDLVAVESLKKLFVLSGTKIYEVGLR